MKPILFFRDIQKATKNFTTILGQGSFGPVYKAVMPTGGVVAVKVLASDSKQGEREFHTEVCIFSNYGPRLKFSIDFYFLAGKPILLLHWHA